MEIEQLTAPGRDVGQGHQPPPRAAAGQPALPQAPQRPAGAPDRHRRRADVAPRAGRRGLLLLPAAPADGRATPSASSTTPAGSARRRRSSGSARTRAWPASSTRWPAGSTAGWSPPSSTTSAPRWSAPTSAPGARGRRRAGSTATGSAAGGSGSATEEEADDDDVRRGDQPAGPARGARRGDLVRRAPARHPQPRDAPGDARPRRHAARPALRAGALRHPAARPRRSGGWRSTGTSTARSAWTSPTCSAGPRSPAA